MLKTTLIMLLLLCTAASAMTEDEKYSLTLLSETVLNDVDSISSAAVSITDDNVLNIWVVPSAVGDTKSNIVSAMGGATGVFVQARRMYPELDRMDLTIGASRSQAVGTAYCLGSWADTVRFDGDTANVDDLTVVGLKVMGTMQSLT